MLFQARMVVAHLLIQQSIGSLLTTLTRTNNIYHISNISNDLLDELFSMAKNLLCSMKGQCAPHSQHEVTASLSASSSALDLNEATDNQHDSLASFSSSIFSDRPVPKQKHTSGRYYPMKVERQFAEGRRPADIDFYHTDSFSDHVQREQRPRYHDNVYHANEKHQYSHTAEELDGHYKDPYQRKLPNHHYPEKEHILPYPYEGAGKYPNQGFLPDEDCSQSSICSNEDSTVLRIQNSQGSEECFLAYRLSYNDMDPVQQDTCNHAAGYDYELSEHGFYSPAGRFSHPGKQRSAYPYRDFELEASTCQYVQQTPDSEFQYHNTKRSSQRYPDADYSSGQSGSERLQFAHRFADFEYGGRFTSHSADDSEMASSDASYIDFTSYPHLQLSQLQYTCDLLRKVSHIPNLTDRISLLKELQHTLLPGSLGSSDVPDNPGKVHFSKLCAASVESFLLAKATIDKIEALRRPRGRTVTKASLSGQRLGAEGSSQIESQSTNDRRVNSLAQHAQKQNTGLSQVPVGQALHQASGCQSGNTHSGNRQQNGANATSGKTSFHWMNGGLSHSHTHVEGTWMSGPMDSWRQHEDGQSRSRNRLSHMNSQTFTRHRSHALNSQIPTSDSWSQSLGRTGVSGSRTQVLNQRQKMLSHGKTHTERHGRQESMSHGYETQRGRLNNCMSCRPNNHRDCGLNIMSHKPNDQRELNDMSGSLNERDRLNDCMSDRLCYQRDNMNAYYNANANVDMCDRLHNIDVARPGTLSCQLLELAAWQLSHCTGQLMLTCMLHCCVQAKRVLKALLDEVPTDPISPSSTTTLDDSLLIQVPKPKGKYILLAVYDHGHGDSLLMLLLEIYYNIYGSP